MPSTVSLEVAGGPFVEIPRKAGMTAHDSFISSAEPFYYWEFLVNGVPATKGIGSFGRGRGEIQF